MKKTNVVKYFYDIYIYNYVIVNVITEFLFYCLKTAKTFPKIAKMFCNPKFWMFMLKIDKKDPSNLANTEFCYTRAGWHTCVLAIEYHPSLNFTIL